MAFHALNIFVCERVCLATDAQGQTLYQKRVEGKCVLGDETWEPCMLMASCNYV